MKETKKTYRVSWTNSSCRHSRVFKTGEEREKFIKGLRSSVRNIHTWENETD